MYGIYGEIIEAAQKAAEAFGETEELLEYPEVQADKAYYLSVLKKYNELKALKDKLAELKSALTDEREASALLSQAQSDDERDALYEEISSARNTAAALSGELADALGVIHIAERVYCRLKLSPLSVKIGEAFCESVKEYLLSRGAVESERRECDGKGALREISFIACGEGIVAALSPLTGAHKVSSGGKSDYLRFAVTPAPVDEKFSESDLKIDLFRSSGAGGQHINKTESAVRVTHIPTGITVTCQDERSQLENKKRAVDNLKKRVTAAFEKTEKARIEEDIYAQYRKKSPISFDLDGFTMTDARIKAFTDVAFPPADFNAYIDGLKALCR